MRTSLIYLTAISTFSCDSTADDKPSATAPTTDSSGAEASTMNTDVSPTVPTTTVSSTTMTEDNALCGESDTPPEGKMCNHPVGQCLVENKSLAECVSHSKCHMDCRLSSELSLFCHGCSAKASCGDGELNTSNDMGQPEECDDGNLNKDDAHCTSACKVFKCGDGLVHATEEKCDDGKNDDSYNGCAEDCSRPGPHCGDEHKDPEEQCDDGMKNADNGACKSNCATAVCGDGEIWEGVEECDDGNNVETDACLNSCKLPKCGDGIVQAGVEECDDGNAIENDACSNGCQTPRVVFVTSGVFKGNLGGLEGADAQCVFAATNAELPAPATYRAWLSDNRLSANQRLDSKFTGKYILPDMVTVVADGGWNDLVDGGLDHAINMTQAKDVVDVLPWTGTDIKGGNITDLHCANWTSETSDFFGSIGRTNKSDNLWTAFASVPCSIGSPLYCIQGPHS